jgi:hypothetical protein
MLKRRCFSQNSTENFPNKSKVCLGKITKCFPFIFVTTHHSEYFEDLPYVRSVIAFTVGINILLILWQNGGNTNRNLSKITKFSESMLHFQDSELIMLMVDVLRIHVSQLAIKYTSLVNIGLS